MTQGEFKAWFEGFAEAIGGVPNKAQWERIKARAAEIDGKGVTERVYIDRYIEKYWPIQPRRWYYGNGDVYYSTFESAGLAQSQNKIQGVGGQFSSTNAMYALGKNEGLSQ